LFDGLNPPQREAVMSTRGPVLILAGAGTGKTKVITHRIAYLIEQGVAPRQILALTFTNKAAREMKERAQRLLQGVRPKEEIRQLFAGTFHSFCVLMLRRYIDRLGYKANFTIMDEGDQMGILKKILGPSAKKGGDSANRVKFLISLAKNKGIRPEQASHDALLARVYRRYQQELKALNAVDFDDLLVLMLDLLVQHPDVRGALRAQYKYLMVDEYQDTNGLQYQIVRQLASDTHDVCVVGDDDQSIYSWRGAENSHILEFERDFPGAKIIKLEQNYRCTPRILAAANHVIGNNARRRSKKLWADGPPGDPIWLVNAADEQDEASWVVEDIVEAREELNLRWEEIAVLYRANHLSRTFEMELRRLRVPYRIVGGQAFYERREVKDILAYLQMMAAPDNDAALLRSVNTPARGIGAASVESLIKMSQAAGTSVWQVLQGDLTTIAPRAYPGLTSYRELVRDFQGRFARSTDWAATFREMVEAIGYFEDLKRTCRDHEEYQSRVENVQGLVSSLATYKEKAPEGTLQGFIDAMLLNDLEEKDEKEDGYGVTLMTFHGAKGLEFTRVYLVGLEEGILPHERVKMEGNIEEERRLFYVGITRAKKWLILTRCDTRKRYGNDEMRHPSTFLKELPEDGVESMSTGSTREKVEQATAATQIGALRARLAAQWRGAG
jgi:superfamily I DNA/RNA helicase